MVSGRLLEAVRHYPPWRFRSATVGLRGVCQERCRRASPWKRALTARAHPPRLHCASACARAFELERKEKT